MIDTIGNCLINRERRYENHLDVTCLQINNQVSFTGMVWYNDWIFVSALGGSLIVISTKSGNMERSFNLPNGINKLNLIEPTKNLLINCVDRSCCLINITDLLKDIKEGLKPTYLNFSHKCKISYQLTLRGPVLTALYNDHVDIYDLDNLVKPTLSYVLPQRNHN